MVDRAGTAERTTLQTVAMLVSIVFVLVGILGFIPGITEDGPGKFAGEDSEANLLGIFQVSILHNIVHLGFGLVGLAMARSWDGARMFLIGGGALYLALWLLGLLGGLNWLPADDADNWLHFALGAAMIGAGLLLGREREAGRGSAAAT